MVDFEWLFLSLSSHSANSVGIRRVGATNRELNAAILHRSYRADLTFSQAVAKDCEADWRVIVHAPYSRHLAREAAQDLSHKMVR